MSPVELATLCVRAFGEGRDTINLTMPGGELPRRFPTIELLCVNPHTLEETWACPPMDVLLYLVKAGVVLLRMQGNQVLIGDGSVTSIDLWKHAPKAVREAGSMSPPDRARDGATR